MKAESHAQVPKENKTAALLNDVRANICVTSGWAAQFHWGALICIFVFRLLRKQAVAVLPKNSPNLLNSFTLLTESKGLASFVWTNCSLDLCHYTRDCPREYLDRICPAVCVSYLWKCAAKCSELMVCVLPHVRAGPRLPQPLSFHCQNFMNRLQRGMNCRKREMT